MFKSKILFILGAGSGAEVGLPYGGGFTEKIVENLSVQIDGPRSRSIPPRDQPIMIAIKECAKVSPKSGTGVDSNCVDQCKGKARQLISALIQASPIDQFVVASIPSDSYLFSY